MKDTITYGNNSDGVEIVGDGCQTVENVQSLFNFDSGFEIEGAGTVVLKNILAIRNRSDGIHVLNIDGTVAEPFVMYIEDATSSSNGDTGMQVNDNDPMDIQFFGTTIFSNNDEEGIEGDASPSTTYTFNDLVIVDGNGYAGLDIDDLYRHCLQQRV